MALLVFLTVLVLACQAGISLIGWPGYAAPAVVALFLGGMSASLWAAYRTTRGDRIPLGLVVAAAVCLRLLALPMRPGDDVNRYLWEGHILLQGENPFARPPDDPSLDPYTIPCRSLVNHPDMTAVYPPLTQLFGAAVAALWLHPFAFKIAFTLLDLATFALVLSLSGSGRGFAAFAYGLSPLLSTQIAGEGHNEILWIFPAVLSAFLVLRGRPGWGVLTAGAAAVAKPTAVCILPFILAAAPPVTWPLVLVVPVAATLPFLGAGWGLFDSLVRFSTRFQWNNLLPPPLALAAMSVALGSHFVFSRRRDLLTRLRDGTALWILLLPTLHLWYVCGLVPFCALRPRTPWWFLITGIGFWYLYLMRSGAGDVWVDTPWVRVLVFGPVLLAWGVVALRRIRHVRSNPPSLGT